MLGSWQVESTYFGILRPSVLYACRNDVHSVTSPTMPTASAPPETADCICGLMSAVPSLTGITSKPMPAALKTKAPSTWAPWMAAGTFSTRKVTFLRLCALALSAMAPR